MAKYLITVTETYRVDTEEEAARLIEEAKDNNTYTLSKYSSVHKERKQKGEIIDEYQVVTAKQEFNVEKDPENCFAEISYSDGEDNYGDEVAF